jgi:hypothetical protein
MVDGFRGMETDWSLVVNFGQRLASDDEARNKACFNMDRGFAMISAFVPILIGC